MHLRASFLASNSHLFNDYLLISNDDTGLISFFGKPDPNDQTPSLPNGSFILPTFVDCHLHAPQFLYQGTGLHLPLLQWLDEYAFKAEERIDQDPELARSVYTALARRLKEHGTGAVALFGTLKEESNLILAQVMHQAGIRAFVGKVSMDISTRPSYIDIDALNSANSFVENCRNLFSHLPLHRRLVQPILTPRFIPTCSNDLLRQMGAMLAHDQTLRMQSHMSESEDEVAWVLDERGAPDVDVFDKAGLLTSRTLQAHCTFLSHSELDTIAEKGTSVAHCPLSNAYFSSSRIFPLRESLQRGVKVGLGTDIAGGYSVDIMNAMRSAVLVSKFRGPENAIDWKEALDLATRGGRAALGLDVGSSTFQVGSPFDAQKISLFDPVSGDGVGPMEFFDGNGEREMTMEMIEKWWCIGDVRNRGGMWVQGRRLE